MLDALRPDAERVGVVHDFFVRSTLMADSQFPFYPLKAPHKHMRLGWKLSEDEIFNIVGNHAHAARDLVDLVRMKWAAQDGEFGDSPYIGVSEDRGYYILMVHCKATFKREFIERHVRIVKECFHMPDSLDSTFGWHMTR